ncbi:MAG TPA: isoprenylcysteine carboxylmethyltransferase family protein [Beijerinckiaceae bacterium]|mgnify:CR=1 FL=1|nr:isoprenylcysteine carboxylmethyltransferase family protein [Beijerinckiaceae bacterium]
MSSLELKYPPVAVFLVCAVLVPVLAFVFPGFGMSGGDPWKSAIASLVGSAGLMLGLAGVVQFRMHRTTVHPQHPERSSSLVTDGVYGFTRNPMYLGLALVLAAFGVFYMLHLAGVLCTAAFVFWMNRFQIEPEERMMQEKFGAQYHAYSQRVRRWI